MPKAGAEGGDLASGRSPGRRPGTGRCQAATESQGSPLETHEAIWTPDTFATGIGTVVAARIQDGGRKPIVGVFVVDISGLGVKTARYDGWPVANYRERIRGHGESRFTMEPLAPACARRWVEESMAYAQALGCPPHPETARARRAFEGVEARECTRSFTFGRNGKPFHGQGPQESRLQTRQILRPWERRCGPGNYDYLVSLSPDF